MPVNLSVKNVADAIVERLRERAWRHHRSLQSEVRAILDEATSSERIAPAEAWRRARELKLRVRGGTSRLLRAARDGR